VVLLEPQRQGDDWKDRPLLHGKSNSVELCIRCCRLVPIPLAGGSSQATAFGRLIHIDVAIYSIIRDLFFTRYVASNMPFLWLIPDPVIELWGSGSPCAEK
jgi:hypothetical protein